jgi:hypothetical protein
MKSKTTPRFRKLYEKFPQDIKRRARKAYLQWQQNPNSAGLYFKRVSDEEPIYSVRIGLDYRAIGSLRGDTMFWYWIGKHDVYERLLK